MPPSNPRALVAPVADYKIYVTEKVRELVTDTRAFTDAVKAGDVAKAKALFAPTRAGASYEAIRPSPSCSATSMPPSIRAPTTMSRRRRIRDSPASIASSTACSSRTTPRASRLTPTS